MSLNFVKQPAKSGKTYEYIEFRIPANSPEGKFAAKNSEKLAMKSGEWLRHVIRQAMEK